ncbi:hypothetical protein LNP25_28040 [Klebsiella variicola subsp. variicola]|nr:hypothetical protein [Klebsiella variicola subsp. variicola]
MINQLDIPDSDVYIQGPRLADADIIQIRRQIGFVMQKRCALSPSYRGAKYRDRAAAGGLEQSADPRAD